MWKLIRLLFGALAALWSSSSVLLVVFLQSHENDNGPGITTQRRSSPPTTAVEQPKGVFILKVSRGEQAARTLCTLTRFFNNEKQNRYPIRIFADFPSTPEALRPLFDAVGPDVDLQVLVDEESWRYFPATLTEEERKRALKQCKDPPGPNANPKCTKLKVNIGYAHMGYWRYAKIGKEESLKEFDYYISMDADTYFTQPMEDPFRLMHNNNLTGVYNIAAYQFDIIGKGIQETSEALFSLEERQNRYLNSPQYSFFDNKGKWRDAFENQKKWQGRRPSIWGCFYGGRLDFMRTPKYEEFARKMAPYTYIYRTDEQPIISVAWSLMADNDKIWYLPKRGIHMGVYHHGWIDDSEVVKAESINGTSKPYNLHTLDTWANFDEGKFGNLMRLREYMDTKGYAQDDPIYQCFATPSK